jgi:ABC-type sugar transport system permease subunit
MRAWPAVQSSVALRPRFGRRCPRGALLMIAPMLVLLMVFGLVPMLESVWLVLHRTDGPGESAFIGLSSVRRLLTDERFGIALANTGVFLALSLVLQVPTALLLALVIERRLGRLGGWIRLMIFMPHLVGPPFAATLFTVILGPRFGPANRLLGRLGLEDEIRWLSDPALIVPTTAMIAAWLGIGVNTVIFQAALRTVDPALGEAAHLDGAGPARRLLRVTLPAIRPVFVFVCVLTSATAVRVFDLPWILQGSGAGPDDAGLFLVSYLYETGFVQGDLGYGATIGWTVTVVVATLAIVQERFGGLGRLHA